MTLTVVDLDELEARMEALLRRVLEGDSSRAVTKQEAAERLGVSLSTVDRMIRRGELPVVRVGRSVRVPLSRVLQGDHAQAKVVGGR